MFDLLRCGLDNFERHLFPEDLILQNVFLVNNVDEVAHTTREGLGIHLDVNLASGLFKRCKFLTCARDLLDLIDADAHNSLELLEAQVWLLQAKILPRCTVDGSHGLELSSRNEGDSIVETVRVVEDRLGDFPDHVGEVGARVDLSRLADLLDEHDHLLVVQDSIDLHSAEDDLLTTMSIDVGSDVVGELH